MSSAPSSSVASSSPPSSVAPEEDTFYPRQFSFELFRFPVSEAQLELKRSFYLPFAFEVALLEANVQGSMVLDVCFGTRVSDTEPGAPGPNIDSIDWGVLALSEQIELSGQPQVHTFAVRVNRTKDDESESGDALSAEATKYLNTFVTDAPAGAEFWVKADLHKFDVTDPEPEPRGVLVLSGLTLPDEYEGGDPSANYGTAEITG